MPLLKDTEREQLRQLVKACLLEISKLKIELKKCQKESSNTVDSESILKKAAKEKCQAMINNKNEEITKLTLTLKEREKQIAELQKIKGYFEAIVSRPKKDLTSFQSQIYELLPYEEDTAENLYAKLKEIGFSELSHENFEHALRNLERKGYFTIKHEEEITLWKKLDKND